jgi:hypothetical protein
VRRSRWRAARTPAPRAPARGGGLPQAVCLGLRRASFPFASLVRGVAHLLDADRGTAQPAQHAGRGSRGPTGSRPRTGRRQLGRYRSAAQSTQTPVRRTQAAPAPATALPPPHEPDPSKAREPPPAPRPLALAGETATVRTAGVHRLRAPDRRRQQLPHRFPPRFRPHLLPAHAPRCRVQLHPDGSAPRPLRPSALSVRSSPHERSGLAPFLQPPVFGRTG